MKHCVTIFFVCLTCTTLIVKKNKQINVNRMNASYFTWNYIVLYAKLSAYLPCNYQAFYIFVVEIDIKYSKICVHIKYKVQ